MPVRLIAHAGPQPFALDLKDGVYKVGREKPADIVIPDRTISGSHAELQISGDEWMVRDLGSTNGTLLNEQPVRSAAIRVRPGSNLRFGAVNVTLESPVQQAAPVVPAGPGAATVKMQAAKQAAGRLQWNVRYWIAGAEAILFLIVLLIFIQIYGASAASQQAQLTRYRLFAAQYTNVLTTPGLTTVPAPTVDESLGDPLVADREGVILYPTGSDKPLKSPLIDPATKAIYPGAKFGFFTIPGSENDSGVTYRSYPVRSGGNLVGYVLARPGSAPEGGIGFAVLLIVIAGAIALMLLFFALKPVNTSIRQSLEAIRLKVVPYANGMVEELPRSATFAEANGLADEVEKAIQLISAGSGAAAGGQKDVASERMSIVTEMVGTARLPYCAVDGDFRILFMSPNFNSFSEFSKAREGVSLFDAGLTSIQAKQLVQTIGDARRDGSAEGKLQLIERGTSGDYNVTVRTFARAGNQNAVTALLFTRVG